MSVKSVKAKKNQKGFTLIEFSIVAAVIALLIYGIVQAGNTMFGGADTKKEKEHIQFISDNVKKMYEGTNYNGLTNAIAQSAKVFPKEIVDNAYNHSWNAAVTVAVATVNGIADSGYAITYASVPSEACVDLVTGSQGRFDVINIAGTDVKTFGNQLNRGTTGTNCGSAATVDIIFTGR